MSSIFTPGNFHKEGNTTITEELPHENFHVYCILNAFISSQGNSSFQLLSPALKRKRGTIKLIRPSVCHKNFNLAHIFLSINGRALIFGMHDPCNKPLQSAPWRDLDLYLKVKFVATRGTTILRICLFFHVTDFSYFSFKILMRSLIV